MPATGNSAPAADRREAVALSLVVGALAAVMLASHRAGHWWGDDWALYVRQAQALIDGEPGRVLTENRFTVDHSIGPAFSPPLYPWGFPLLLAPFVAVFGPDLDRLALVPVLSACAFACAWYVLARRRLGFGLALIGVVVLTISPVLLGWTDLLQSELPFMAVSAWSLVAVDRVVRSGKLLTGSVAWSVWLGVLAAASFTVRREGLAVVAAIGVAQLVALADTTARADRGLPPLLTRATVPHAVAAVSVLLLQTVLPTTTIPRYQGTSLANMWRYRLDHARHLAELVGLKRPWDRDPVVLGSEVLGWVVTGLFLWLAIVGTIAAVTIARRRDAHLAAYAGVAFVIGASFRVPVNRYVCTVAPVLLLLAMTALVCGARRVGRSGAGSILGAVALAAIVIGNLASANIRIERAADFAAAGGIEWGPTHPAAVEMFEAVESLTDATDVVAAPKARAMTFATGRLAVQVDEYRRLPDIDVAVIVADAAGPVDAQLATEPTRYERVWSNRFFVIYRTLGV